MKGYVRGPAGHWKDLAFPLIEMGKLLEQHYKNGRLTTGPQ